MNLLQKTISCIRIIPILFKSDNFYIVFSKDVNKAEKELNFIPFGFKTVDIFSTNKWLTHILSYGKISLKYDTTIKVEQEEFKDISEFVEMANNPKIISLNETEY
jgi:hypothetical protein